jgi:hypothetical protein
MSDTLKTQDTANQPLSGSEQHIVRLLSCPFCGSDTPLTYEAETPSHHGFRAGCCNPCCDINPYTRTIWPTPEKAMESWNRRPNAQDQTREPKPKI